MRWLLMTMPHNFHDFYLNAHFPFWLFLSHSSDAFSHFHLSISVFPFLSLSKSPFFVPVLHTHSGCSWWLSCSTSIIVCSTLSLLLLLPLLSHPLILAMMLLAVDVLKLLVFIVIVCFIHLRLKWYTNQKNCSTSNAEMNRIRDVEWQKVSYSVYAVLTVLGFHNRRWYECENVCKHD